MKIIKIGVAGLYGTFNKEVVFDKRLNLLVGINGSGKTTVLNCLDWMLKPDIPRLASNKFDKIEITFVLKNELITLIAQQSESELTLSISGGRKMKPVKVGLFHMDPRILYSSSLDERINLYKNLAPEPHERELWNFLHTLPTPLTVTLDRTITAEADDIEYVDSLVIYKSKKDGKRKSPIDKVLEVVGRRYSVYRDEIFKLNEDLKNKMVISAFRMPSYEEVEDGEQRKITLDEIERIEKNVSRLLFSSLRKDDASYQIAQYFDYAKHFVTQLANEDEKMWSVFWLQFQQFSELTEAFDDYEKKSSQAYAELGSYISVLNNFLKDSSKRIGFDAESGTLAYQFLERDSTEYGAYRSVKHLSSGERQILILITFLAFVCEENQVFIIDEPELSLHPRWQSSFLEAILSQSPKDVQLILATHSPEIVSNHTEYCKLLEA